MQKHKKPHDPQVHRKAKEKQSKKSTVQHVVANRTLRGVRKSSKY